eukprot:8020483-Prorocentrum_lima.AAC.1
MPDKSQLTMKGTWGVVKCPGEAPCWAKDILKLHPIKQADGDITWKTIDGRIKVLKEEKHKYTMVAIRQ